MNCPSAEVLSRSIDGLVPGGKIEAHLQACGACSAKAAELKGAGEWLKRVAAPGPACLTPDEMALAIGGRLFPHVDTCPRCAAELRDLKPRKKGTTKLRVVKRPPSAMPMIAAAAALLIAAVVAVFFATRPPSKADVAKTEPPKAVPREPERRVEGPKPDEPKPAPERDPRIGPEAPKPDEPKPQPKPDEPKSQPKPDEPKPVPDNPTKPEEPARTEVAIVIKSGSVTISEGGKWVKPARVFEGVALRADGKTKIDFAGAKVTLDAGAEFSLAKSRLSLSKGGLSAEIPTGSKFALMLGTTAIVPQAKTSRVILVAREDRVVVDEGSAKSGDLLLGENEEFDLKKGLLTAKKSRSLAPMAAREALTWKLDIQSNNATRGKLPEGRLGNHPGGGRALSSTPYENSVYAASLRWFAGGDYDTFAVKQTTAVRFRYFLKDATNLRFSMRNRTKDENFGIDLDPVVGKWTTVTLFVTDIPVNTGGRAVTCEPGDKYGWFGWNIGKPGDKVEILVDQFEVLEIEK